MEQPANGIGSQYGSPPERRRKNPYLLYWSTAGIGSVIVAVIGVLAAYDPSPKPPPPSPPPSATTTSPSSVSPVDDGPSTAKGTVVVQAGYSTVAVHAAQWISAPVTAYLGNGAKVTIYCTVQGGLVTDNGHQSTLWNKIDGGYIPDADVYTGTDQPTMPNCPS